MAKALKRLGELTGALIMLIATTLVVDVIAHVREHYWVAEGATG